MWMLRTEGIKHHDSISSLHSQVQRLSLQQNTLFEEHKRQREDVLAQYLQGENKTTALLQELQGMITRDHGRREDILAQYQQDENKTTALLQELQGMIARDHVEATPRWETLKVTSNIVSAIQRDVHAILEQQPHVQNPVVVESKTDLAADNVDVLARRLLRAELSQQLEPLVHQFDEAREQIDQIALAISAKANNQDIFQLISTMRPYFSQTSTSTPRSMNPKVSKRKDIIQVWNCVSILRTSGLSLALTSFSRTSVGTVVCQSVFPTLA
jgi:hypothetical protein